MVKSPPPVDDAPICKDGAVAFGERDFELGSRLVDAVGKHAQGAVELPQLAGVLEVWRLSVAFEGRLEGGGVVYVRDALVGAVVCAVEDDGGVHVVVVVSVVVVVEGDGVAEEALPEHVARHAHRRRGAEGVGEDGAAALDGVFQTVEELHAGRGLKVEEVHVQAEF